MYLLNKLNFDFASRYKLYKLSKKMFDQFVSTTDINEFYVIGEILGQ